MLDENTNFRKLAGGAPGKSKLYFDDMVGCLQRPSSWEESSSFLLGGSCGSFEAESKENYPK